MGEWQDEEDILLSLKTPELGEFESLGKRAIYNISVKVSNLRSLAGVKVSRWTKFFGMGSSPRGCWRSLYKPPVDKRTGDLQWRIVHRAIATYRYLVHLDPGTGKGCPFCSQTETLYHLFIQCSRLAGLFRHLQSWFQGFGEHFSFCLFIYGPRYSAKKKKVHTLINCQIGSLENKEEPCEGCGVRGRGYDAERAAGSSAQGGVWFLQTDKKDRSLCEHLVCAKCAVFSQRGRFVSKCLIYFLSFFWFEVCMVLL